MVRDLEGANARIAAFPEQLRPHFNGSLVSSEVRTFGVRKFAPDIIPRQVIAFAKMKEIFCHADIPSGMNLRLIDYGYLNGSCPDREQFSCGLAMNDPAPTGLPRVEAACFKFLGSQGALSLRHDEIAANGITD
jgi:hypothetical protein